MERLEGILAASSHTKLRELVQPLLFPGLRLVLSSAAKTRQLLHSQDSASLAAEAAPTASHAGMAPQQGSTHRQLLEQEAQQGMAWLMLGTLRLHLVITPAGPDPAAKHAHKRSHLLDLIGRTDAELEVYSLFLLLHPCSL